MENSRIECDGVRLAYVAWQSALSSGPAVVALHGMSSNALFWTRVASRMRGRQVVALDLRGHGRSEPPDSGYTVAAMAADVACAIGRLNLATPVVVGHSWGAAVGLEMCARSPSLASALVLIDGPTANLSRRMSFELADKQMRPPPPCYRNLKEAERDQARFLANAWGDDLREFVHRSYEQTTDCWRPVLPEAGRAQMVRELYELQPETLLPRLPIPVAIIAASDDSDRVAPDVLGWWRSQAGAAAALCRAGRAERYASRHDIPLIRANRLAADLEGIIQKVARRA